MTDSPTPQSPMDVLIALYHDAPNDVRAYLQAKVGELINVEMPKLSILKQEGPFISRGDMLTVSEVYTDAMNFTQEHMPEEHAKLSATVRDGGHRIAKAVDATLNRIMLEDTSANRHAYITILSTHAKLVKSLDDLTLSSEEQQEHDSESDRSEP